MAEEYKVTHTQPYTYQTPEMRLVNGYRVYFVVLAYNETFYVDVPIMDKSVIDKAIAPIVQGRKAIGLA